MLLVSVQSRLLVLFPVHLAPGAIVSHGRQRDVLRLDAPRSGAQDGLAPPAAPNGTDHTEGKMGRSAHLFVEYD